MSKNHIMFGLVVSFFVLFSIFYQNVIKSNSIQHNLEMQLLDMNYRNKELGDLNRSLTQENGVLRIHLLLKREIQGKNKKLTNKESKNIIKTVFDKSSDFRLDPLLIFSIMDVESDFIIHARSKIGARGLMQVRPIVFKELERVGLSKFVDKESNITKNITGGMLYLKYLEILYGDLNTAVMVYNLGPSNYKNQPTTKYLKKVQKEYLKYERISLHGNHTSQ